MAADEPELAGLRQLQALIAYPREGLDVELKGWLDMTDEAHQADFVKAILALANHGGGFVLIGFGEENGTWVPDEARSEEHTSELQSRPHLVCRLLLEKK